MYSTYLREFWQGDILDFFSMYCIQHCFICRPSDSTVSEDAGIEPGLLWLGHWQSDVLTTRLDLVHGEVYCTLVGTRKQVFGPLLLFKIPLQSWKTVPFRSSCICTTYSDPFFYCSKGSGTLILFLYFRHGGKQSILTNAGNWICRVKLQTLT